MPITPFNQNITTAVGNTPLVKLQRIVPVDCADVYVKLEYFNPTGSYKDRMALSIIEKYEEAFIPKVVFKPIPSLWGHTAGAASNPADAKFLNDNISSFLK